MTVANKPGHRGARRKPLKPLRGESRVFPSEPVVTTLVCFFHFAREAAGASRTWLSLRPLSSEGQWFGQTSDAWRRENAGARSWSDEAIHSFVARDGLLRFQSQ